MASCCSSASRRRRSASTASSSCCRRWTRTCPVEGERRERQRGSRLAAPQIYAAPPPPRARGTDRGAGRGGCRRRRRRRPRRRRAARRRSRQRGRARGRRLAGRPAPLSTAERAAAARRGGHCGAGRGAGGLRLECGGGARAPEALLRGTLLGQVLHPGTAGRGVEKVVHGWLCSWARRAAPNALPATKEIALRTGVTILTDSVAVVASSVDRSSARLAEDIWKIKAYLFTRRHSVCIH